MSVIPRLAMGSCYDICRGWARCWVVALL